MRNLLKDLYCVVANYNLDQIYTELIEEKFNTLLETYLEPSDVEHVAIFEINDKVIYLLNINKFKVLKIVEFFSRYNLLVSFEDITDKPFNFIYSNKYLGLYDDEYNKKIIDNYILENMTIDNILDRINDIGYEKLLPIELKILNPKLVGA